MIRVIVFDLDDTLYLEKEYVMSGYNAVATYLSASAGLDRQTLFDTLEAGYHRGNRERNFEALLARFGLSIPVEQLISIYRRHRPTLTLPPDAQRALNLTSQRYGVGMITDGHPETQSQKIDALGIRHYFDKIVVNDLTQGRSKHQSDSFYEILTFFSVAAHETAYVGDNPGKDFTWPLRLGMSSIRIQRPGCLYRNVPYPACADSVVTEVSSLDGFLSVLNLA